MTIKPAPGIVGLCWKVSCHGPTRSLVMNQSHGIMQNVPLTLVNRKANHTVDASSKEELLQWVSCAVRLRELMLHSRNQLLEQFLPSRWDSTRLGMALCSSTEWRVQATTPEIPHQQWKKNEVRELLQIKQIISNVVWIFKFWHREVLIGEAWSWISPEVPWNLAATIGDRKSTALVLL